MAAFVTGIEHEDMIVDAKDAEAAKAMWNARRFTPATFARELTDRLVLRVGDVVQFWQGDERRLATVVFVGDIGAGCKWNDRPPESEPVILGSKVLWKRDAPQYSHHQVYGKVWLFGRA